MKADEIGTRPRSGRPAGTDRPTPRRFLTAGAGPDRPAGRLDQERSALRSALVWKFERGTAGSKSGPTSTAFPASTSSRRRAAIWPVGHAFGTLGKSRWATCPGLCSDQLVSQLNTFPHLESVMFAGFGEPTAHPDILRMIRAVKRLGLRAEITTNGTLLDDPMIDGLRRAGLDVLWASFDSAGEAGFEDIRRGAKFGPVVAALQSLQAGNARNKRKIRVGLSFVVMRRNVTDLEALDELARQVGADKVLVSNILPYSAEMEKEMLCALTLSTGTFAAAPPRRKSACPGWMSPPRPGRRSFASCADTRT